MTGKHRPQTVDELRAEMRAAAVKLWDGVDVTPSPHLVNAIRRVAQSDERRSA